MRAISEAASRSTHERVWLHDLKPELADVRDEVHTGLTATPKRLSPKFYLWFVKLHNLMTVLWV